MTIHDLRRMIKVISFDNECIIYKLNDEPKSLIPTRSALSSELINISSIESPTELDTYKISQWDALNLVIRHEYAKHMEADLMNSDLFKAIANITKP